MIATRLVPVDPDRSARNESKDWEALGIGGFMHQVRRSIGACAAAAALVSCLMAAPSAMADTRPLDLSTLGGQFSNFACLNDSCSLASVNVTGKATSNLATGNGNVQQTLKLDFSPGGSCNIVDETDTFIFDAGTILIHSHHEDCATHGLRVDTTFEVTGGSGAFANATGGGREFASAAAHAPIIYNGVISF